MLVLVYEMMYDANVFCTMVKVKVVNELNGALIDKDKAYCLAWLTT